MASECKSLPILKIKARNNYDVGFKIGQTFKRFIKIISEGEQTESLVSFYNTNEGRELYNASLKSTTECYPLIVEEIKGMSEGSGVQFERLYLQSMLSEILFYYTNPEVTNSNEKKKEIAGCSDVIVNNGKCRILAHNEDWGPEVQGMSFLIDVDLEKEVTFVGKDDSKVDSACSISSAIARRHERYLGFIFPGNLAGLTSYVTKFFAASVNTLVPKAVNFGAVPPEILLRAMIGCQTIDECADVMRNDPIGCSYGVNVNIASRYSSDMWTLEVYSENGKTIVDVKLIASSCDVMRDSYYVHTNHYKHVEGVEELKCLEGSRDREATASQMEVPQCIQDVCRILGDTSGVIQSIYRQHSSSNPTRAITIATSVFDLNNNVFHVYLENPKDSENPNLSLGFPA